ncbi:MAG: hypothetical protein RL376_1129, partial [Verrucomicrobiota bacterium]
HEFNTAVATYIEKRTVLASVFVLIDSRLEPQAIDLDFLRWLTGCDVEFALVFTKTDKQSATQTRAAVDAFLAAVADFIPEPPAVFISSSTTKAGRKEILAYIAETLAARRK